MNLLLNPGDVAFTHSNLLHCSRPNLSPDWRRNFILAYNSKGNEPIQSVDFNHVQPLYNAIDIVGDDMLMERGCSKLADDPSMGYLDPNQENYKSPAEEVERLKREVAAAAATAAAAEEEL